MQLYGSVLEVVILISFTSIYIYIYKGVIGAHPASYPKGSGGATHVTDRRWGPPSRLSNGFWGIYSRD
jgi:hypothetical protein